MPDPIDSQAVKALVAAHLPAPAPVRVTPIATGKFNTSFFADAGAHRWVVRIAPPRDATFVFYEKDMMRQEPDIHALLLAQTAVPVAPIVAYDDSLALLDRDYIIMERLPGQPISDVACDYAQVLYQLGQYLAQVHAQTATTYGYIGAHRPMPPQDTWVDAFAHMWHRLLDGIVAVGHYDQQESAHLRRLLDQHMRHFDRPLAPSLLHMDVWAQNILVDGASTVTGIVDWDRALWGDPEIEYAVLDYCGISEPAFWRGYGRQRDTSAAAQIRRTFYLLYELQKYIIIRQGRNKDAAGAKNYKRQVWDILNNSGL